MDAKSWVWCVCTIPWTSQMKSSSLPTLCDFDLGFLHQPFSEQTIWQIPFPIFQAICEAKTFSCRQGGKQPSRNRLYFIHHQDHNNLIFFPAVCERWLRVRWNVQQLHRRIFLGCKRTLRTFYPFFPQQGRQRWVFSDFCAWRIWRILI